MIVGCKQDLERVELPYVEIEAMVTIIKMKKILLILLVIRKNITLTLLIIDLQVSLDWECGYTECSSLDGTGVTGVFRFNFFFGIFGRKLKTPYPWNIWQIFESSEGLEVFDKFSKECGASLFQGTAPPGWCKSSGGLCFLKTSVEYIVNQQSAKKHKNSLLDRSVKQEDFHIVHLPESSFPILNVQVTILCFTLMQCKANKGECQGKEN